MIHTPFKAPSLETMDALLPAFEFIALIAADEMGAVYLTNQRSLGRDVAIKILSPHLSNDPLSHSQFESTCRSMARLNHPNLTGIYDSGSIEQMLYFVMEFVPGKSLGHSTKGQPVHYKQALLLTEGICSGIAHAHQHEIIHGALNLRNVLLNKKATPKVTNFGFARHLNKAAATSLLNSRFIAPEILQNAAHSTPQSDIFSLGAILYELITGKPHRPDAAPPSTLSDCPTEIDAIWRQATHLDLNERTPDASAMLAALTAASADPKPGTKPSPKPKTPAATVVQKPAAAAVSPASPINLKLSNPPKPASLLNPPKSALLSTPPKSASLPTSPLPPPSLVEVGFNWKLIRNLCIIAGLIYAITLAWDLRQKTLEGRQNTPPQIPATVAKTKLSNQPKSFTSTTPAIPSTKNPEPPKPTPVPKTESPTESLARLRNALASGKRDEMPVGSIRRGTHDYFVVSDSMSWPEATWFAEQHGGHLAIPSTTAPLTWLIEQPSTKDGLWLGAARNGLNSWALADGSSWNPKKQPSGIGQYLASDQHGFLRAENAKNTYPFIIQWHLDGSNPGALTSLLASTQKSLTQPNPKFPPGTRTFGVRRYYYSSQPMSWKKASSLAETAGGHLAVPSSIAEISNLGEMAKDITATKGIWLGASFNNNQWQWITGEPWKDPKWADETKTTLPNSALILRPGKGWDTQSTTDNASGFIIEWSKDRK